MSQLEALLLTLATEVPVALTVALALGWSDRASAWKWVAVVAAASLLTHPLAWWASVQPGPELSWELRATAIETSVVLVETLILHLGTQTRLPRAFAVALVMNTASFAVGVMLAAAY